MAQEQLFHESVAPSKSKVSEPGVACQVLLDTSGYEAELTYLLPDSLVPQTRIGSLVTVSLRGRNVRGWITAIDCDPPAGVKLEKISKVSSVGPSPEVIDLCRWISKNWFGPFRRVMGTASPDKFIRSYPVGSSSYETRPVVAGEISAAIQDGESIQVTVPAELDFVGLASGVASLGPAIIVVPSISQVDPLVADLRRSGIKCASFDNQWDAGLRGQTVIGTGKAVLASVESLKSILVLDSHSSNYKMRQTPNWDVASVALERASRNKIAAVLASPCPSIPIAEACKRSHTIEPSGERIDIKIVDMTDTGMGMHTLFSSQAVQALRAAENGLVVLNRKGRTSMLSCRSCRELIRSSDGSELMVEVDSELLARRSGETRSLLCANCGSTDLLRLRLGIKGASVQMEKLLSKQVVDLDASADVAKNGNYIIGTEAALYRRFAPKVICFADIDNDLLSPGLNSTWRVASQVIAAKRMLQKTEGSKLVIQTRQPDSEFIDWIKSGDFSSVYLQQKGIRETLKLPPFGAVAKVSGTGAERVTKLVASEKIGFMGPKDGAYLLSCSDREILVESLNSVPKKVLKTAKIAVDPWDL